MLAFLQARRTSTRLPDKIYKELNGAPILFHAVARAKEATLIDDVVIVSPHELPEVPEGVGYFVWDGDEMDVLGRFAAAARSYNPDYIVRLTSDCPLLDPHLIDAVVHHAISTDYCSNVIRPTFPDGVDVEVISRAMLSRLDQMLGAKRHREHVTIALREMAAENPDLPLAMCSIESFDDYSKMKWSVDDEKDFRRVCAIERSLFQ